MPSGYDSVFALYANNSWSEGISSSPYPLAVISESFDLNKEIRDTGNNIHNTRVSGGYAWVPATEKPKGQITLGVREPEVYRLLCAHFQMRKDDGNGTNFLFYPTKKTPNYGTGVIGTNEYGGDPGDIYSLSVLKILAPYTTGVNNAQLFHKGIIDKLDFTIEAGGELEAIASFVFKHHSVYSEYKRPVPYGGLGFYDLANPFQWHDASILFAGESYDIRKLQFSFSNNLQEISAMGNRDPVIWKFGEHETMGAFEVFSRNDSLNLLGTMIGTSNFAVTATFRDGANGTIIFDFPYCKLQPFNITEQGGQSSLNLSLQFKAFSNQGSSPVKVRLFTANNPDNDLDGLVIDAGHLVMDRSSYDSYDAGLGERDIGTMTNLDRDL